VFIPLGWPYVGAVLFVEERSRRSAVGRVAAVRPAGGDPARAPRDSGLFTSEFCGRSFCGHVVLAFVAVVFAVTWLWRLWPR